MNTKFYGEITGAVDFYGTPIRCGDRVEYYEHREGYRETHGEDGWGRDIKLCRHDQYDIPAKAQTTLGTVVYDPDWTGFVIKFDDFLLESGNRQQNLYVIANGRNGDTKLTIIN